MDENKRFREFDRFFRAIVNNAHDVVLVRKVIDVCSWMTSSRGRPNTTQHREDAGPAGDG